METDLVKILLEMKEDIAATRQAVEALTSSEGRITKLENAQSFNRWYSLCIVPFVAIAHGFARKFGVNI